MGSTAEQHGRPAARAAGLATATRPRDGEGGNIAAVVDREGVLGVGQLLCYWRRVSASCGLGMQLRPHLAGFTSASFFY